MSGYAAIKGRLDALFPGAVTNRVHRRHAPQSAKLPYFVVQRLPSQPAAQTFDGATDTNTERYQVTAWATTPAEADRLGSSAESALADLHDASVQASYVESIGEDEDADVSGEGRAYAVRLEVEVWRVVQEA